MIGELYALYYEELTRYLIGRTHARALSEDLTQETFLRALAHADELEELSGAQCRAWLYRTAKNLLIDHARRQARTEAMRESEAAAFDDLSAVQVEELIGFLPAAEREIFRLRTFEGWRSNELGERFGLPAATVRARLASARKKLAILIAEQEGSS